MDIFLYRDEIDEIDNQICHLLIRRMAVSAQIAQYKIAHGLPIEDFNREREMGLAKEAYIEKNTKIDKKYIQSIFEEILNQSKMYQRSIVSENVDCLAKKRGDEHGSNQKLR